MSGEKSAIKHFWICGRRELITRDKKGFNDFDIVVMTPAEFVNKAKE